MPCDDELIQCVGRDKVVEICKGLGCMLYVVCVETPCSDLCVECYTEIRKKYPECGRSV